MSEFTDMLETLGLAPFVTPVDFNGWTTWSSNPASPSYPSDESVTSSTSGFDSLKSPTMEAVGDVRGYQEVPVYGKFETVELTSEKSFESFTSKKIGSDLGDRVSRWRYFANESTMPAPMTAPERRPFNPFDDEDEVFLPPSPQEKMTNSAKPCWDLGLHSENITTWTYVECAERNAASENGVKAVTTRQAEVGEGNGLIERGERPTSEERWNQEEISRTSTPSTGDLTGDRKEGQAEQTARELRLEVAQFIRERTIYRKDKAGAAKRQHLNLSDDSMRRAFLNTENVTAGPPHASIQLMNGYRREDGKPLVFLEGTKDLTLLDLMVHGGSKQLV